MSSLLTWIAICSLGVPLAASAADPLLIPTPVRGGDCVAVQISALKPSKATFFTDHCGDENDPVFIALDGQEYALKRKKGVHGALPFQGTFVGDGLEVVVKPIRLLDREPRSKDPIAKDDYRQSKFEVQVIVTRGQVTKIVNGEMSQ
jgi:hypothetical protein